MRWQVKHQKTTELTYLEAKKQQTRHRLIYFRGFVVRKKNIINVLKSKNSMKGKCYAFSRYKQKNKVCLV